MKSLFNAAENQEIIDRINQLTATTNSHWGKMSGSQMLAHLQGPLRAAFGEVKLKRGLIGILLGGIAKKKLMGAAPFQKNLPTDKYFIVKGQPDFEEEKKHVIELIQRFEKSGEEGLSKDPHPFFGKLNSHEWDSFDVETSRPPFATVWSLILLI